MYTDVCCCPMAPCSVTGVGGSFTVAGKSERRKDRSVSERGSSSSSSSSSSGISDSISRKISSAASPQSNEPDSQQVLHCHPEKESTSNNIPNQTASTETKHRGNEQNEEKARLRRRGLTTSQKRKRLSWFLAFFCAFSVVSSLTREGEEMNTSCLLPKGRRPLQVRWQFSAGRGFTSPWQHGENNPQHSTVCDTEKKKQIMTRAKEDYSQCWKKKSEN